MAAEYSTATQPANPTTSYLTTDLLGSPRVITDRQGNVISRRDFMPFGEEIGAGVGGRTEGLKYSLTGSDNVRQRFTGYEKDIETELDFAQNRMYRNKHGRFTSPDPLLSSASLGNPQTINRYVYVGNNPVNVTDPSGLNWCRRSSDGATKWTGPNVACEGEYGEDLTTEVLTVSRGSFTTDSGYIATKGDEIRFNSDGTTTLVQIDPKKIALRDAVNVEVTSNPASTVTVDAPAAEVGSTISPRQTDRGPDLGCPEWADSACGSGNSPVSPSLDTSNNEPLKVVEAIHQTGQLMQFIPGLNVPGTVISTVIDLGRGDFGNAGMNTVGLIPFGNLFKRGNRIVQAVDEVADASRALCFLAGTLIHTDRGIVPIEEIKAGDTVLSYNEANGALEYREVVRLFRNTAGEFLRVHIEGEPQTLQVTFGHPFYVHRNRNDLSADDGDWIAAESLKTGDLLRNSAGEWKPIVSIERVAETRATFNFEVEGNHNYFVGLGGWLVHNDCTDIAMGLQKQVGGGRVIRIQQFLPNGQESWLNAGNMYQQKFAYHDVFVFKGKVYDKMSKFGDKPIPFKQWVRIFDPQSAKNPNGVTTVLRRIN